MARTPGTSVAQFRMKRILLRVIQPAQQRFLGVAADDDGRVSARNISAFKARIAFASICLRLKQARHDENVDRDRV